VNSRWQAEMAEFFVDGRPDRNFHVLTEVFNLDDQLGDQR
jgi:L-rhamnose mutarotase